MYGAVKTHAIVLRKRQLPGKDLLLSIYSEASGKLVVMAKGALSITSRRLSQLQTGNYIEIVLKKKHEIYYVEQVYLISLFTQIRKSQKKTNQLYFLLFLIDSLLPENQKEQEVFRLLLKYLSDLSKKKMEKENLVRFCNRLLLSLGYDSTKIVFSDLVPHLEGIIGRKIPEFII